MFALDRAYIALAIVTIGLNPVKPGRACSPVERDDAGRDRHARSQSREAGKGVFANGHLVGFYWGCSNVSIP